MNEEDALRALAASGVKRARALGADAAEVYVRETRATSFIAHGEAFAPNETFSEGVGVRVLVDGRLGASSGDAFATLDEAARRAVESAKGAKGRSLDWAFASPQGSPRSVRIHPAFVEGDADHASALAARVHGRLLAAPDVTYAGTTVRVHYRRFAVANSEGIDAFGETGWERVEVEARVSRGTKDRTARDSRTAPAPLDADAEADAFVDAVVGDARGAFDDASLGSPVLEAVLAPPAASQVVEIFLSSLSGQGAATGQSALAKRLGDRVVSDSLTLRDLPLGPGGRAHRAVDDEGVPTRETTLVERGVLRAYAHDANTARAAGLSPSGQGIRKGLASVSPQVVNPVLDAGDLTFDELVEGAERAVLITQPLLGAFVANHVTGDFSVVAPFAYLVEGGKVRHALPATTVAGNVHRVLADVRALGKERRGFVAATVPAMRVGGISCAT